MRIFDVCIIGLCIGAINCDIYLHNPRGSNNRLDEATRERATATRLFDSQNNNRGGYNTGSLYYYAGSVLPIEWTNQHSCGDANSHCDIVLQYMCSANVRDGVTQNRIPDNRRQCVDRNCDTDSEFGLHESYSHRLACTRTRRNQGLFLANQRPRGQSAAYTRQNANGQRYGYECPEERDYYPYWRHSPWRDIAVLTNHVERCQYYRSNSQNVMPRYQCQLPDPVLEANPGIVMPINETECVQLVVDGERGEWRRQEAWQLASPVCRQAQRTRDNHLGNTEHAKPYTFNWTVPAAAANSRCILRVRYNISTGDYNGWATVNGDAPAVASGLATNEEATNRGFTLRNNPQVQLFPGIENFKLQLQINTAQYGRVFQDRSHVFHVRPRPDSIPDDSGEIFNVNVRGKRGNIVQVYPSVEYDFTPTQLHASPNDWIHLQWTGSNTNNRGNDGQGLAGTDRSNLVPLVDNDLASNIGSLLGNGSGGQSWHWLPVSDAVTIATLSPSPQLGGSLEWLNDAGTYFDLGPRRITASSGNWSFISSRNNNFSNRSHKWRLVVSDGLKATVPVDKQRQVIELFRGAVVVKIPASAFTKATFLEITVSNSSWSGSEPSGGDTWFTNFLSIHSPDGDRQFSRELQVTLATLQDAAAGHDLQIYGRDAATAAAAAAQPIRVQSVQHLHSERVTFAVTRPGVFAARGFADPPVAVLGIIAGVLVAMVIVAAIIGAVVMHLRNPKFFEEKGRFIKRSFQGDV